MKNCTKGRQMTDATEVLQMMRQVARTRISMLKDGITFHDQARRAFYLQEYEEKLRNIEDLIRRINIRLVRTEQETPLAE
jgi:hypothetical protein